MNFNLFLTKKNFQIISQSNFLINELYYYFLLKKKLSQAFQHQMPKDIIACESYSKHLIVIDNFEKSIIWIFSPFE
jgi:hypothetical protein